MGTSPLGPHLPTWSREPPDPPGKLKKGADPVPSKGAPANVHPTGPRAESSPARIAVQDGKGYALR